MTDITIGSTIDTGITIGNAPSYPGSASLTASGVVYGTAAGVLLLDGGTLLSHGNIYGATAGVQLTASSYVDNAGIITSPLYGAFLTGGTLSNAGFIGGSRAAVAGQDFTLIVEPGAQFGGTVLDGGANNTLDFAGTGHGTLNGLGTSLSGFTNLSFGGAADWTIAGNATGLAFGETISGFHHGDALILDGFAADTSTFTPGTGLVLSQGPLKETLYFAGSYTSNFFMVTTLSGNTEILAANAVYALNSSTATGITLDNGIYTANFTITNAGIAGGGIYAGPGTVGNVIDDGTIQNGLFAAGTLNLTMISGAAIAGPVSVAAGTLALAGATAGTFDMGTSFTGFTGITFDGSAPWALEGSIAALAGGQSITGLGLGDQISLDGFDASTESFIAGAGLVLGNGTATETLAIAGNLATSDFTMVSVASGTVVELIATAAPCFCRGTRIATARGNVAVEHLALGDLVRTDTRGPQPIRWIGSRAYEGRFIAGNHLALPVCIHRHALAPNVPNRDLYVSPDHAICEGGVLVHAWRLVNGVSITQAEQVARVEYFHLEFDRHEIIFAEGTPVESFLDAECRQRFQHAMGMPATAAQTPCRPRVEDGFHLARIKARIDERAGLRPIRRLGVLRGNLDETTPRLRGWAQDMASPETPVALELLCDGVVLARLLANRYRADLRAAGLGSGCHAFDIPCPPRAGALLLRRRDDGAVLGAANLRAA